MDEKQDVVVVGAGPTGLLLAGDLAEAGVGVTVLERRRDESNLTRAFAVHARSLEVLDMRGCADDLLTTGAQVRELALFGRVRVDLGRLPSRFAFILITPQYETERVLQLRLDRLGVRVRHGAEVTGVEQDDAGVTVTLEDGTSVRARYVVGADGSRSVVRRAIGRPFPGRSVLRSIMLADVRLAEPPADVLTVNGVREGFAFIAPFGDDYHRIFAWDRRRQVDEHEPLELDEVRDITRRAMGTDFGMHDPRWLSRFHSDERQVPEYRVGRVFLAGDAAHVHSPAGGQGMNVGLQDAANLGWKLAAVIRDGVPTTLLDSYHAERHPVAAAVIRGSGGLIRLAMMKSRPGRAVRDLVARAALSIDPIARRITGEVSGIGVRYPAPAGAANEVGTRMPDVDLADGGRLFEALRGRHHVLLRGRGASDPQFGAASGVLPAGTVMAVPAEPLPTPVLVRPDGYVAATGGLETDAMRPPRPAVSLSRR
ncbi:FAD-dependent monooxygenase [Agromyces sp. NPDC049794]|uniref:FAD-dependent monooxygenase n=1 Tax=unclassified Agromyces TaxID=2639701 RepID=UPI0033D4B37D